MCVFRSAGRGIKQACYGKCSYGIIKNYKKTKGKSVLNGKYGCLVFGY
jgi:hypothetical protein